MSEVNAKTRRSETLPAPWEWDVKGLVASSVLAARANGLSDHDGCAAAVAAPGTYRKRLAEYARMSPLEVWYESIDIEDFLSLITDPALRKQIKRRIAKASQRSSGSELGMPPRSRV